MVWTFRRFSEKLYYIALRTGDAIDYQICGTLFFTRLFYDSRGPRIPTFTVNIHFRGFRTHGGVSWDPFFILPLKSLILHQVGVFACWRRVFCWKCLKPSPGGLQDRLSLPIEEKKISLTSGPKTIGILSKYWAAPILPADGVKWYFQGLRSWKIIFVVGS